MTIDAVTPDLIYPVLLMVGMWAYITREDKIISLVLTGLLFLPISWIFAFQLTGSEYLFFCEADITAYTGNLPGFGAMLSMLMFAIPLLSFAKIIYLKKLLAEEEPEEGEDVF